MPSAIHPHQVSLSKSTRHAPATLAIARPLCFQKVRGLCCHLYQLRKDPVTLAFLMGCSAPQVLAKPKSLFTTLLLVNSPTLAQLPSRVLLQPNGMGGIWGSPTGDPVEPEGHVFTDDPLYLDLWLFPTMKTKS